MAATRKTATQSTAARKTAVKRKTAAKKTAVNSAIVNNDAISAAEDMTANTAAMAREQMQTGFETMSETMATAREQFEKTQNQLATVNKEFIEAARTEVSDAVQFTNDLVQAKTFADALSVQQAYFTNLFQSRVEHTQSLTEKSVEMAREVMTPQTSPLGTMMDPKAFTAFFPFAPKA